MELKLVESYSEIFESELHVMPYFSIIDRDFRGAIVLDGYEFNFDEIEWPSHLDDKNVVYTAPFSADPSCKENNTCLIPRELHIEVGESVTWIHYSRGECISWEGGTPETGPDPKLRGLGSNERRFDEEGIFPYFCMVHPWKVGTIIVGNPDPANQPIKIPEWIKTNAKWWHYDEISEQEFLQGIEYLIENDIIVVSIPKSTTNMASFVPNWIKDTAGWWAEGKVTDQDFVNGIQWLIENGIIRV